MRISRIELLGGNCPPLKPSMKIDPPDGPAEGPAKACRSACKSSGLSPSASRSLPDNTNALAFEAASVLTAGPALSRTSTSCLVAVIFKVRFSVCEPGLSVTRTGFASVIAGALAWSTYSPGGRSENTYDPRSFDATERRMPPGPVSVTLAFGTRAPVSSATSPRREAVCAKVHGLEKRRNESRRRGLATRKIPPSGYAAYLKMG